MVVGLCFLSLAIATPLMMTTGPWQAMIDAVAGSVAVVQSVAVSVAVKLLQQ